ncbi:MAG: AmmeMemoRadiSam system protein A [Acidimicrobiia bacterium]|nr:AmmeMemoRadiSam system protein A [Acidimicrobiia bacterium]
MAPSPSPEIVPVDDHDLLVDLADEAIAAALNRQPPPPPRLDTLPAALRRAHGAFVSLHVNGELNGCIGALDAAEPVGQAVPRLALSAAFADPRLPPLRAAQYGRLHIEVSVLSATIPVPADDRRELVGQLRPGIDGLVLRSGHRQGLFLPVVWQQLPAPEDFVHHLLAKAGLHPVGWPADLQAERFTAQIRGRPAGRGGTSLHDAKRVG